ncbi:hypothetical protein LUZ62_039440 [Rhynchospora pubera]|uniref:Uncharacterized protein n=1 Tax=Rhynchospora pubera TaxID=906938 RepID=A0AAV8F4Z9_9POAL|nr:hypothetical protein LUZ62_039440 [Rhynchospora pubera]
MDNKGDRLSTPSSSGIFQKLIPKSIAGDDFPFEKETVPCNTPISSFRYRNAANGINLKDSDEYIRDPGSILSLQPWIFKRESNFSEKAGVCVNESAPEISGINVNLGLRYGRNRSSIRARRGRRNSIKPLSLENCLIPQLYDEKFEFEEYVFKSLEATPVTRPFVVTDGKRVISKSGCEASLHMPADVAFREVDCLTKKKGVVGVSPLPEMRIGKRKSVDFDEARFDISGSVLRSRLQSPSEGSRNSSTAFIFCIGVCIGVLSAIIRNRNEVEKLNDKLRSTENLVQDLQEELEMKDALTVQELLPHENASRSVQEEDGHSMSKIEAELEAELEMLELNITASSIKGKISVLDEVDQDLVGEIVQGELRADTLSRRDDDLNEIRSDNSSNSSFSPVDTNTCNYPVSPRQLSLRLHEVLQERLELRIQELEKALAQSQEQLQLLENERSIPSERTLSNSEMGSSSLQDSPTVMALPSPFCLNLTGDALDAYSEACEEFMQISGEDKKENSYEVDRSLIWGLEGKNGYDCHGPDDDDDDDVDYDDDEDDDDDVERLIIEKIVERTKQGSPVIRHAQLMLLSLDD